MFNEVENLKDRVELLSRRDGMSQERIKAKKGDLKIDVTFFKFTGSSGFVHENHDITIWEGKKVVTQKVGQNTTQLQKVLNEVR